MWRFFMTANTLGIIYMITGAGPVVKGVLLCLLFFSITTWAIILIKWRYIRKAQKESADFTGLFWQCKTLSDAFSKAKALKSSPVARIFITGYMELSKFNKAKSQTDKELDEVNIENSTISVIGNLQRSLRRSINIEVRRLTQLIPFLATAGNTSPFIGLFGTVWGIMSTFQGIGLSGSASLAVVAPGISEALIATAAGLAVAIPSVIAYNYFIGKVKLLDSELQGFATDLLNIIERETLKQRG
jgi:biopolymer transport protein TolQ